MGAKVTFLDFEAK